MKTCLLDVNVLLALVWPHHIHHANVHRWWAEGAPPTWSSCTQTQLGFVRVSCHPKFVSTPATPAQASQLLHQMTSRPDHRFWPEIPGANDDPDLKQQLSTVVTHGQVTDAYLAALARRQGGRLITLDRSLVSLYPDVAELVG